MPILRPARADDLPHVRRLLADNALPVADLETAAIEWVVAEDGGRLLGAVGLEVFDDAALLRSLVVDAGGRGSGLGGALVTAIEAQALASGAGTLSLLTQTAEPFFARRGWLVVPRDALPAGVQRSGEFRSICPASATAMVKTLEPAA